MTAAATRSPSQQYAFLCRRLYLRSGCYMAQAAWKRPGSPIGRTGPRKAHPKYKRKLGQRWSDEDVRQLRSLAKGNTPTGVLSLKLQRPEAAIRSKAQRKGFRSSPPIARPTTGVPVSPSLPAIPCRRVPQQTARCLGAVVDFAEQHGLEPLRLGRVRSASMRWRGADNPAARSRKRRFSNLTGVHELATLAPRSFFPRRRHPWGSQKLLALSS
jgi:hypothetical protein